MDKNMIETFFDMLEDAKDFYDENEDRISKMLGTTGKVISLEDGEPLVSPERTDKMVIVTIETKEDGLGDFKFLHHPDINAFEVRSSSNGWVFKLPDNALPDRASAEITNGVLDLKIPRKYGGDDNGTD